MPEGALWTGLGWVVAKNSTNTVWHNGGTYGFSAMAIVDSTNDRAVVAMSNSGANRNVDALAAMLIPIA